ncbi:hypothetical protein KAK10_00760 [Periweissella beninensis]|uniref:Uncharacterized protein n=1 Tax=Periweissella beninensis TaxID=504936 RepID=A0ABT0VF71_9LACO|nr:hypothetical protein [Periweissella beninensis]
MIPKIQANVVNSYDETTISSDEFENNFTAKGNATFQSSNEAILTNDIASQVGYIVFNDKINMNYDFKFAGQIYLGKRDGADGVSFILHPNDQNIISKDGDQIGISGIPNAVGFKLDIYFNGDVDPVIFKNKSFGAFLTTDATGETSSSINAQQIDDPDETFKEITIKYNAQSQQLTINYENKTFIEKISM